MRVRECGGGGEVREYEMPCPSTHICTKYTSQQFYPIKSIYISCGCACESTFLLLSSSCSAVSCFLFLCSGRGKGVAKGTRCSLRNTRSPSELSVIFSWSVSHVFVR